jgi:hypothetical protein
MSVPPVRICALEGCDNELEEFRRSDARFCCDSHRAMAHQRAQKAPITATGRIQADSGPEYPFPWVEGLGASATRKAQR